MRGWLLHARQRPLPHRACSKKDHEKDMGEAYAYSDPFNAIVGKLLPKNPKSEPRVDFSAEKRRGMPLKALAAELEKGLSKNEWFVSGDVGQWACLFSDEFSFSDDTVAIKGGKDGLRQYATGVKMIFDQETSRAQVVGVRVEGTRTILVRWRLEGGVNVGSFKLKILPYLIDTTLIVDSEGLIANQTDRFLVPGIQIVLGALFGPWAGPPPPPPLEILRAEFESQK
jgi:hypothetical protein